MATNLEEIRTQTELILQNRNQIIEELIQRLTAQEEMISSLDNAVAEFSQSFIKTTVSQLEDLGYVLTNGYSQKCQKFLFLNISSLKSTDRFIYHKESCLVPAENILDIVVPTEITEKVDSTNNFCQMLFDDLQKLQKTVEKLQKKTTDLGFQRDQLIQQIPGYSERKRIQPLKSLQFKTRDMLEKNPIDRKFRSGSFFKLRSNSYGSKVRTVDAEEMQNGLKPQTVKEIAQIKEEADPHHTEQAQNNIDKQNHINHQEQMRKSNEELSVEHEKKQIPAQKISLQMENSNSPVNIAVEEEVKNDLKKTVEQEKEKSPQQPPFQNLFKPYPPQSGSKLQESPPKRSQSQKVDWDCLFPHFKDHQSVKSQKKEEETSIKPEQTPIKSEEIPSEQHQSAEKVLTSDDKPAEKIQQQMKQKIFQEDQIRKSPVVRKKNPHSKIIRVRK